MGIAGVNKDKSAAPVIGDPSKVKVRQSVDNGIRTQRSTCVSELKDPALQIVIKIFDRRAAEFSPEFPGVLAFQPREVVEDLKGLAGASARNTETDRSQIFNSSEIKFGQTKLAGPEVQTNARRVEICIQRTEGRAITAVTKAHFIDLGTA